MEKIQSGNLVYSERVTSVSDAAAKVSGRIIRTCAICEVRIDPPRMICL
jgi:hypothetical protein